MPLYVTRREACLRAFKTLLEGITVANGYTFSVTKVERGRRNWDDPTVRGSYPYIGFWCEEEDTDEIGSFVAYQKMHVTLIGFIDRATCGDSALPDVTGIDALAAFQDSVIVRIANGQTLGGYAIACRPGKWLMNDGQVFDDGIWIRGFQAEYEIEYERSNLAAT